MRNEPNFEIFLSASSSRIEAAAAIAAALTPSSDALHCLKEACLQLEATISAIGQGDVEDQYRAYQAAAAIFVLLADWKHAVRNAEPDAQRYLNSAKLKASEIDKSSSFAADERLIAFLDHVDELENVGGVAAIQNHMLHWDLPLLLFANPADRGTRGLRLPVSSGNSEGSENPETTVAFLKFEIDGEPAKRWNYLKPRTSYDLTIEVRVSNWPKGASVLSLTPVTVEILEQDWLPDFRFAKPEGNGPFILTGTRRAVIDIANSFGSRPFEFLYAAEFDDMSNCRNVEVVGHRRLLLEGCDVDKFPLSGFSNVDRHLLAIRDKLRTSPGLQSGDVANAMIILGGLGNIAAQALKGGLFEAGTSERQFQNKATEMLRNRSDIGERLQGHQEAAGGITDLSFSDIPIELKVEKRKILFPKDCSKFFDQLAAYAIALGKRVGVLSILETSPKSAPLGVVEDDIEVFLHQTGQTPIVIVVVIVRGGFPKPSFYSR